MFFVHLLYVLRINVAPCCLIFILFIYWFIVCIYLYLVTFLFSFVVAEIAKVFLGFIYKCLIVKEVFVKERNLNSRIKEISCKNY